MSKQIKFILVLLRLSMGWVFLYSGLGSIFDFDSTSFVIGAEQIFSFLIQGSANISPVVDTFVEWGMVAIGGLLIIGGFVRPVAVVGSILMFLVVVQNFEFPQISEHLIYFFVLILLSMSKAGRFFGLDRRWRGY